MNAKPHARLALALCAGLAAGAAFATFGAGSARADDDQSGLELDVAGFASSPEERQAFVELEQGKHVKARELAEQILRKHPSSYVAELVLGRAFHFAENDLPRALYHLNRAAASYAAKHGDPPRDADVLGWHRELLVALIDVHGDLEHYELKLQLIEHYNALYEPVMIAERAWPLMKLGRYAEARLSAQLGLQTDQLVQHVLARNALCAIEFEAGNDGESYEACKDAVDLGPLGRGATAVDLTNLAEAARSLFRLDEAERVALEATAAQPSWFGNPWLELAELYVRQGRFGEGLSALRKVPEYRLQRPPHVRDADRNEHRRVIASFLVLAGKPEAAIEITGRGLASPDRRAHNSRDPAQDLSALSLLDRLARRTAAERALEKAATAPWLERPALWLDAAWLRLQAAVSDSQTNRLLADDKRLVGTFRIGTASSAVMPPWLVSELVDVMGAGVVRAAVAKARAADTRPGAGAYYDAVEAEAARAAGDPRKAIELGRQALKGLGPSEALLRARVHAVMGAAASDDGRDADAAASYQQALERDPGVVRRLGLALPVRPLARGGEVARETLSLLLGSPRFTAVERGLALSAETEGTRARVCLHGGSEQVLACADVERKSAEGNQAFARRVAAGALEQLFAPRVDLSQGEINSLDGQNLSGRNALEDVLE